jgi:hypothetical protein
MYSDHPFESDTAPGTDKGRCKATMIRRDGSQYACRAPFSSVLHPQDQFGRHWCSALEQGYDCMHFEGTDS